MAKTSDDDIYDRLKSPESLAKAIVKISDGVSALLAGGLNQRAIVILLHHSTKVAMKDIAAVLEGLKTLKDDYINPATSPRC
jgi:hypothetical protein